MFGTDGKKKSHLIAFLKCQENLQDGANVTAEKMLGAEQRACTAKRLNVLNGSERFLKRHLGLMMMTLT